jgi:hypothetical protein
LIGLGNGDEWVLVGVLVKIIDDLDKSFDGKALLVPLDLLEKRIGSTFSKSSASARSDAFRLPAGDADKATANS